MEVGSSIYTNLNDRKIARTEGGNRRPNNTPIKSSFVLKFYQISKAETYPPVENDSNVVIPPSINMLAPVM